MSEDSNFINGFGNNVSPALKKKLRERLHDAIKEPGHIRDQIVCNRGDVADQFFDATISRKAVQYLINTLPIQRFIAFCDVEGYLSACNKNQLPLWDVICFGMDEAPSQTGGGISKREKDGGMFQNVVHVARQHEIEIREMSQTRFTRLGSQNIPAELAVQFAELQKIRADFGMFITELLPLAWVGIGKVYVKSFLLRLGVIQGLFFNAKNADAIRDHLTALHSTISAINVIADKEDHNA